MTAPAEARTSVLRRYVDGEITAELAADLLGPGLSIAEVILAARSEMGRLPDPRSAFVDGEYRRALALLGLPAPDDPPGAAARPE